jgi:uncharacterized membrane protein YbhN (UPF0104 family)
MKENSKKAIKVIAQLIIILVIGYFFGERLYNSWSQLGAYDFRLNIFYFFISLVFLGAGFFLVSFGWSLILSNLGKKIKTRKAFYIWAKSEMAKYIPGMVWTAVGRAYLSKKDKAKTFLSVLIELKIKVLSSLIVAVALIYPLIREVINIYIVIIFILAGLVAVHPRIFESILNIGLKIIKKKKARIKSSYSDMLLVLLLFIISWFIIGFGFSIMAHSVYSINFSLIPQIIGIFCLSWAAGFLFLIMPGGIGIREGVMVLFLQSYMPVSIAIIISIIGRIWWTLGDLAVLLTAKLISRK